MLNRFWYFWTILVCTLCFSVLTPAYSAKYDMNRHRADSIRIQQVGLFWNDSTFVQLRDIAEYSWQQGDLRNYFEAGFLYIQSASYVRRIRQAQIFLRIMQARRDSLERVQDPDYIRSPYSRESRYHLFRARFYYLIFSYSQAKNEYQKAIIASEKNIKDSAEYSIIGQAYNALGNLCYERGNIDSAYMYISKGLYYRTQYNNTYDLGHSYRNSGLVQEAKHHTDSAVLYYKAMRDAWHASEEVRSQRDWVDFQYYAFSIRTLHTARRIKQAEELTLELITKYPPTATLTGSITEQTVEVFKYYLTYLEKYSRKHELEQTLHLLDRTLDIPDWYVARKSKLFSVLISWYHHHNDNDRFAPLFKRYNQFVDSISVGTISLVTKSEVNDVEMELKERDLFEQSLETKLYRQTTLWTSGLLLVIVLSSIVLYRLYNRVRSLNTDLQLANESLDRANHEMTWANEQLAWTNERLNATLLEKEEIIGMVSHDLKNPLSVVFLRIGLADSMLPRHHDPHFSDILIPHLSETFALVSDQIRRMTTIVEYLLRANRTNAELPKIQIQEINISDIIRQTIDAFSTKAHGKHIILDTHVDKLSSPFIYSDDFMLRSIAENLISNALKFSEPETVITVEIADNDTHTLLYLTVSDQGPGISIEDQQYLYQKHTTLSARPTGDESSTGLGLSIVKSMVDKLHGTIECNSELGKGTSFIVTLPISTEIQQVSSEQ